jgi:type II secretory pathway component PulM
MMKTSELTTVIHDYWQDRALRRKALILMVLAVLYILIIPGLIWKQSVEKELSILKTKYQEFSILAAEYGSLKENVNAIEQKKALTKINSIAQAIDEIASPLGIKGKVKSIKGTGTKKTIDKMSEESAEIQIEKLNMTELMHMFYKIENAPMILAVKKVTMKKSFETPDFLDLTMTVSLFTSTTTP